MSKGRTPLTETGFLHEPLGNEYFEYARFVVGSFVDRVELKWHPGHTGLSLNDFVMDTSIYAIELTKEDYCKGLFRNENENSFKYFFWFRIKKAFFTKLKELSDDPQKAVFDERLGMYYEGAAVDFGPTDENDEQPDTTEEDKPVTHRVPKKLNDEVVLYYYSAEKAEILDESQQTKMQYVKQILDIVNRMSPNDQRLFYLKYQFGFSDADYQMWEDISKQKHTKDPFSKMAHLKYGLSEGYAKKRISQIKSDILSKLNQSGHTPASYRQRTSIPVMLQTLTVNSSTPIIDIDTEKLSEADCRDILVELFY